MEKIRLATGAELELITCGVMANSEQVTLSFLAGDETLSSHYDGLSDSEVTKKMILLSEAGEELAIYTNYTVLDSIRLEKNRIIGFDGEVEKTADVVTVVLKKPDEVSVRLTSLENQITDTQLALCEIYEGMV